MRTSHMQARLLATLDAMDALRQSHANELASEKAARDRLSVKLDRYINYVRTVEAERDDMREATSILLGKGEVNCILGEARALMINFYSRSMQ